jgi:hypothetical protein
MLKVTGMSTVEHEIGGIAARRLIHPLDGFAQRLSGWESSIGLWHLAEATAGAVFSWADPITERSAAGQFLVGDRWPETDELRTNDEHFFYLRKYSRLWPKRPLPKST